ncbi:MAG: polysaccharide deacetylase family protein [Planctomycetota bacterium]|nr:polysaccharide deacetylase family protein [Planctomycetota bacterium]
MSSILAKAEFNAWTGRLVRRLRRRYNDHCIGIVTYHSVSARPSVFTDDTGLRIHPVAFERQIEYLESNFRPTALREVIAALEERRRLERAIVITFDDGYADNLRCAFPILYRRRIPMTVFPVASIIGNADLLWQHKLAWLIRHGHADRVGAAFSSAGYPPGHDGERIADYARRCFRPDLPEILESVLEIAGTNGRTLAGRFRPYVEPDEVAKADPEFVEFGNHTLTHPVLSSLSGDRQRAEIAGGFDQIKRLTGRPPTSFAYPFGLKPHYSEVTEKLVVETGHRAALDMRRRINTGTRSPFDLSRKPAACGSQARFERMIEDWPDNAAARSTGRQQDIVRIGGF